MATDIATLKKQALEAANAGDMATAKKLAAQITAAQVANPFAEAVHGSFSNAADLQNLAVHAANSGDMETAAQLASIVESRRKLRGQQLQQSSAKLQSLRDAAAPSTNPVLRMAATAGRGAANLVPNAIDTAGGLYPALLEGLGISNSNPKASASMRPNLTERLNAAVDPNNFSAPQNMAERYAQAAGPLLIPGIGPIGQGPKSLGALTAGLGGTLGAQTAAELKQPADIQMLAGLVGAGAGQGLNTIGNSSWIQRFTKAGQQGLAAKRASEMAALLPTGADSTNYGLSGIQPSPYAAALGTSGANPKDMYALLQMQRAASKNPLMSGPLAQNAAANDQTITGLLQQITPNEGQAVGMRKALSDYQYAALADKRVFTSKVLDSLRTAAKDPAVLNNKPARSQIKSAISAIKEASTPVKAGSVTTQMIDAPQLQAIRENVSTNLDKNISDAAQKGINVVRNVLGDHLDAVSGGAFSNAQATFAAASPPVNTSRTLADLVANPAKQNYLGGGQLSSNQLNGILEDTAKPYAALTPEAQGLLKNLAAYSNAEETASRSVPTMSDSLGSTQGTYSEPGLLTAVSRSGGAGRGSSLIGQMLSAVAHPFETNIARQAGQYQATVPGLRQAQQDYAAYQQGMPGLLDILLRRGLIPASTATLDTTEGQ